MLWRLFSRDDLPSRAALYRRVHEQFLTRALASKRRYPSIPLRRVSDGGFDGLRRRPHGMSLAARWWDLALQSVDADDERPARWRRR